MRGRTSIALGSGLVVAATVGLAVSLTLILDELKFERKLMDLLRSRLEVLVDEVRDRAEFGLTLGLALPELVTLQEHLDRNAAGDSRLLTLVVHDENGQPLFTAGREATHPVAAAPASAPPPRDGDRDTWVREDGPALTLGSRLLGGFGEYVGGVQLRYSLAESHAHQNMVLAALALRAVTVIAVSAVFALLGVTLLVRRLVWRYGPLARSLAESSLVGAEAVVQSLSEGSDARDLDDIRRVARGISAAARDVETAEARIARIEAGGMTAGAVGWEAEKG